MTISSLRIWFKWVSQFNRNIGPLDPQIAFVEGQLWNLTRLVEYSIKVYGTEQLAVRPLVVPTSTATTNSATAAPRQDETTTMDNIGKLLALFNSFYRTVTKFLSKRLFYSFTRSLFSRPWECLILPYYLCTWFLKSVFYEIDFWTWYLFISSLILLPVPLLISTGFLKYPL